MIVSPYSQAKRKALGARPYELPERVPTREEWTKDESVPACMECEERFTMVRDARGKRVSV